MCDQCIDGELVTLHDIEHAIRQAGLLQQVGDQQRGGWITLRRLENEGVATDQRDREHPHRHHHREVERRDAGDDAERSEEHTSELQSLMRISYAVFCLKKKKQKDINTQRRKKK